MAAGFDVQKVARLACLGLAPEEERRLAGEFEAILEFVDRVRALPLDGVEPAVHGLAPHLPLREDEPRPGLSRERALEAAPDQEAGHFRVPSILSDAKEG